MTQPDPPEQPSDEANAHQLDLARREGDAYHASLLYMAGEVADSGALQRAGDYIVAYAQERAEGMHELRRPGELVWVEPGDANCHLEIAVADAGDRRFVPYLRINATLEPPDGPAIGPFEVPFVWHPGLYHYGCNLKVPGDGRYTLRVRIDPPTFMRHDRVNGCRYADPVEVVFPDIEIRTGRE
jgi:uncharacterized protein involved in high-affinity Fe2+ transport